MKRIRVLFADDHSIVRDGLRALFRGTPGFSIVGEAADGETAMELIERRRPEVAILDITMPKMNGIEVTKLLRERHPEVRILILTVHEDEVYVNQLVRAGANGYVLKNAEKEEILEAVRTVAAGETFFSRGVSRLMIENFIQRASGEDAPPAESSPRLTKREKEILTLVARGLSSREIAEKLVISLHTVHAHRANLMEKLGIHETANLVRYAISHGYIVDESPVR